MERITEKKNEDTNVLGILLIMVAVAMVLSVLLNGLLACPYDDPMAMEDVEYLDSFTLEDSTVVLVRSPEGELLLMEYRRNLLLEKYALTDTTAVDPEAGPVSFAVTTPLAAYPVILEGDTMTIGLQETGTYWGEFLNAYGLGLLLLLSVQVVGYYLLQRKKK